MTNLALNSDNDIFFDGYNLKMTESDGEEIAQRIRVALRSFQGEWFLDTNHGVPYFPTILGNKFIDKDYLDSIFREAILKVEGVAEIISTSIQFDPPTRKLTYSFKVKTVLSEIITDNLTI